ncbi:hypothetical protein Landi51_02303 [Colletotrichum acutatum]
MPPSIKLMDSRCSPFERTECTETTYRSIPQSRRRKDPGFAPNEPGAALGSLSDGRARRSPRRRDLFVIASNADQLCLKPEDPASLSSRIARHEEQYEQLQRHHHSIPRAYFPSVAAGLRPSPAQAKGPSILKCGMACAAHAAMRWDG